ncbi:MAG: hypothetical protein HUU21_00565 [Polyangiaceae bacterium]|nr:hypothetical protein [Polyangiaceae bacterium]
MDDEIAVRAGEEDYGQHSGEDGGERASLPPRTGLGRCVGAVLLKHLHYYTGGLWRLRAALEASGDDAEGRSGCLDRASEEPKSSKQNGLPEEPEGR